jgi:hypothetical protein
MSCIFNGINLCVEAAEAKSSADFVEPYTNILNDQSLRQCLHSVQMEKKKLEDYVIMVSTESRLRLEASIEELKQGIELFIG